MKLNIIYDENNYISEISVMNPGTGVYNYEVSDNDQSLIEQLFTNYFLFHLVDEVLVIDEEKETAFKELCILFAEKASLMERLSTTDYADIKILENLFGCTSLEEIVEVLSDNEYADLRNERRQARARINEIEEVLKEERYAKYPDLIQMQLVK